MIRLMEELMIFFFLGYGARMPFLTGKKKKNFWKVYLFETLSKAQVSIEK